MGRQSLSVKKMSRYILASNFVNCWLIFIRVK